MAECAACGKSESGGKHYKPCNRCHSVSYCGRKCQKGDWKAHKKACKKACEERESAGAPTRAWNPAKLWNRVWGVGKRKIPLAATAVGPLADPAAAVADDDEASSKWNPKNHGSLRNFEHKVAEFVRKEKHKLVENVKHSLRSIEKALDNLTKKVYLDEIYVVLFALVTVLFALIAVLYRLLTYPAY